MATTAAARTFKRTFANPPGEVVRNEWSQWASHYDHLWMLYDNSKFDDRAVWEAYKAQHGLYRYIRSLYNPARRLADFYGGIVYPGILTEDGQDPEGGVLAIPLGEDTPDPLRAAIGQTWQWSNWQAQKNLTGRWGALLGNWFAEVVDDVEGGKVYYQLRWPGLLTNLEEDGRGNVTAYALEYDVIDGDEEYTYRKEVDGEAIRTYRDDRLSAEEENPYGFAPAVWCPHFISGDVHGSGAIRNLGKFDQVNMSLSVLADKVDVTNRSPLFVWGGGSATPLADTTKQGNTADLSDPNSEREKIKILQGPEGGQLQALIPDGVEETLMLVDRLIQEIEDDHPELVMYKELRAMSQVTGPGAERMMGDAAAYINEARSNYDTHSRKLFQMAVAVAGYRVGQGDWGRSLTPAQRVFGEFDLTSYARGDLNFNILPRPVVPETPLERAQRERMEVALERDRSAGQNPAAIEARLREATA